MSLGTQKTLKIAGTNHTRFSSISDSCPTDSWLYSCRLLSPQPSLFRAANSFRVIWSERRSECFPPVPLGYVTEVNWPEGKGCTETRQTRRVVKAFFSNLFPRPFLFEHRGRRGAPLFPPLPFSKAKALRTSLTLLCWLSFTWSVQYVHLAFSPHLWRKRECRRQKRWKTPARFVHAHPQEKSNNENGLLYIIWTSGSFLKILSATSFSCRTTRFG